MFSSLYLLVLAVEEFAQAQSWPIKSRAGVCSQLPRLLSARMTANIRLTLPSWGGQELTLRFLYDKDLPSTDV